MGLDLNLGLKIAGRYDHLGYLGHIFDPKTIFFIYCPFYAIFRPIYAICTPFYAILRHQHCSNQSTNIKYSVLGTCKKNFSVLAQTV